MYGPLVPQGRIDGVRIGRQVVTVGGQFGQGGRGHGVAFRAGVSGAVRLRRWPPVRSGSRQPFHTSATDSASSVACAYPARAVAGQRAFTVMSRPMARRPARSGHRRDTVAPSAARSAACCWALGCGPTALGIGATATTCR